MTARLLQNDTICDLQGQPLRPDAVTVLKALDRLLTVGAYYSDTHDQYLQAARRARDELVGVIERARRSITIEITAQGMMIDKQNVDPHHRNVRLLHELLVPLNIARFEIDGTLTPEDLRLAIAALQKHRMALGHADTFQEVVIEDLPASVQAISRSVLHQAGHEDGDQPGAGAGSSLDDLLAPWSEGPADDGPPESESEQLARQFMDMVGEILENLQEAEREAVLANADGTGGTLIDKQDLLQVKRALERLIEVRPDPADLLQLISQARRALDLSRDPRSANLVFSILKRDLAGERDRKAKPRERKKQEPSYRLTVDQLLAEVAQLEAGAAPVPEPLAGARDNRLGIVLHLLGGDPPEALRHSLIDVVERIIGGAEFDENGVLLCAHAVGTALCPENPAAADDLLTLVTGAMRSGGGRPLGRFWTQVLADVPAERLPVLWPHLVNDILLGFKGTPRDQVQQIVLAAGSVPLQDVIEYGRQLERLPAMQADSASRDLFAVPLPAMHAVHTMLMMSPLEGWLAGELYEAMRRKPLNPLIGAIMGALGEHRPEYGTFYLDLISHHATVPLPPRVSDVAAEILRGAIEALGRPDRGAGWVNQALTELCRLDPERAQPLLQRVVREKRLLFFPAWPEAPRRTAQALLQRAAPEVG